MAVSARYELLEVVGSGGMATVWRARDARLGRVVALKRPHPAPPGSDVYERFLREARTAATVSHPNLVAVFDAGDDDGPYLVMEYVDAPSLDRTSIPRPGMAAVGAQVAAGLAALHAAGIVHGDVKPANILVSPDGAKLTDFGIARPLDASTLTRAGTVLATPAYAAPEVLTDGRRTPASDVYSLAAVLFELVTGSRFEPGSTRAEVTIGKGAWQATLEPALSWTADDRPSAQHVARQLSDLATGTATERVPTVSAPRAGTTAPTIPVTASSSASGRWRRLRWVGWLGAALVAGIGIVAIAAAMADDDPPSMAAVNTTVPTSDITTTVTASPSPTVAIETSTAPAPTTTVARPTSTEEPIDTSRQLASMISAIVGEQVRGKEASRIGEEIDRALESADEGDLEKSRRELADAARRIDERIRSDSARARAMALVMDLAERLGVDPATLTDDRAPGRDDDDDDGDDD